MPCLQIFESSTYMGGSRDPGSQEGPESQEGPGASEGPECQGWTKRSVRLKSSRHTKVHMGIEEYCFGENTRKWYFVTKIVLTYCEKKLF